MSQAACALLLVAVLQGTAQQGHTAAGNSDPSGLVLGGSAVLLVIGAILAAFKMLYNDKKKAEAEHLKCQEERAQEAREKAMLLERLLNRHYRKD